MLHGLCFMINLLRKIISPTNPLRLAWHFLWGLFSAIYYRFPSRKLFVIGITGTNGKTTVANLIAKLLEADGKQTALATTINFQLGKKKWDNLTKMTSLGRGGIQKFLSQAVKAKCTHAVVEISSHALVQHRALGVSFDTAVLTNITREHLDFHKTFEKYRQAKEKLFWKLAKSNKPESIAILPAEDPVLPYFKQIPDIGITTFGIKKGDLYTNNLKITKNTQKFSVVSEEKPFELETKLMGSFNISNILAATALALNIGIKPAIIRKTFKKIEPLPGRLEPVEAGQPFRVIVDFAHTPDALEKLLRTFRSVTSGKIWLVFGATGDRDREKRPVMGKIAHQLANEIALTSDDPFTEDPVKIISEVMGGIPRAEGENFYSDIDRKRAISHALKNAQKGDTVLIAGKGCEQFQVIGHKKIPWDDRKIARQILKQRFKRRSRRTTAIKSA